MITADILTRRWYCCFCSFQDLDSRTLANEGKEKQFFVKDGCFIPLVCQSKWNSHPNVCIPQLLCHNSSSWQRLGVSACVQFKIFVIKVGSIREKKTDLDETRIFHYELSKKLSEAHRNISIPKIPLYDTNSWARTGCHCLCLIKNFYPQKQLHMA